MSCRTLTQASASSSSKASPGGRASSGGVAALGGVASCGGVACPGGVGVSAGMGTDGVDGAGFHRAVGRATCAEEGEGGRKMVVGSCSLFFAAVVVR